MTNLVTVTTQKKGDKNGAGRDIIETTFDFSISYGDMLAQAVQGAPEVAQSLEGKYSAEAIAQALEECQASWSKSIEGKNSGGVKWATSVEGEQGVIAHNKTGARYMMGYVVSQEVVERDPVQPEPKAKRQHRNEVTAVKSILRGRLASNWRMVAL